MQPVMVVYTARLKIDPVLIWSWSCSCFICLFSFLFCFSETVKYIHVHVGLPMYLKCHGSVDMKFLNLIKNVVNYRGILFCLNLLALLIVDTRCRSRLVLHWWWCAVSDTVLLKHLQKKLGCEYLAWANSHERTPICLFIFHKKQLQSWRENKSV